VDTAQGVALSGGTETAYRKVLTAFYHDAKKRLNYFLELPEKDNLSLFTIQIHALKSASAVIGAVALSGEAAALEAAGKEGNTDAIESGLPVFWEHLNEVVDRIGTALELEDPMPEEAEETAEGGADIADFKDKLRELREALEKEKIFIVDRIVAELESQPFDAKTREIVGELSGQILISEFSEAMAITDLLLKRPAR
ncbi:MAG: hypothetical protein LBT16_09630, partial [Treponema sp.]|jgi:HPt (histidine-containing phosphotransfer) domain-containing protein|nr:hypothetical protein [Treponema sp.]